MKRSLFFFILLPLFVHAQTSVKAGKGFKIDGKLDGYADGTNVSLYQNGVQTPWLSTKLLKGKFTMKEKADDPILCFLVIDGVKKPVEIYIENADISLKGSKANPDNYEISGSKTHKDFSQFSTSFMPFVQQMNAIVSTINNTMPGPERDKLMTTYSGLQESQQKAIDNFVKDKPNSPVTPFVLSITYQFNEDIVRLENRFNTLSPGVKKTKAGKDLEGMIAEKKIGSLGTMAMDFTQPDTSGTPVALSSFRGKYVLVDFWASWCGPCRTENPNVVENYNNFRAKNFTVLSVSLDRPGQKDKWMQAISKDNLAWTNVSDLLFWENAAAKLYHISAIPQNILVDPEGKIVAKNLRGTDLRAKLCEILGCN